MTKYNAARDFTATPDRHGGVRLKFRDAPVGLRKRVRDDDDDEIATTDLPDGAHAATTSAGRFTHSPAAVRPPTEM